MERLTFFETIIKLMKAISSVPFFIEGLILSILMMVFMMIFYFKKSKKGKISVIIIYFLSLFIIPVSQFSFFINSIDKIVESFVRVLYFPSWYLYFFIIIVVDIDIFMFVFKYFKVEKNKIISVLKIVYFFIIQFLFFILIRLVIINDIDIFNSSELYSNSSVLSVIQISSYIFWARVFVSVFKLCVRKILRFENTKLLKKKGEESHENRDLEENVINIETKNNNFIDLDSSDKDSNNDYFDDFYE